MGSFERDGGGGMMIQTQGDGGLNFSSRVRCADVQRATPAEVVGTRAHHTDTGTLDPAAHRPPHPGVPAFSNPF